MKHNTNFEYETKDGVVQAREKKGNDFWARIAGNIVGALFVAAIAALVSVYMDSGGQPMPDLPDTLCERAIQAYVEPGIADAEVSDLERFITLITECNLGCTAYDGNTVDSDAFAWQGDTIVGMEDQP